MKYITLFFSVSTLLCCALPALLVFAGLGATMATLVSSFPIIVPLSQNKGWIFLFSAIFILLGYYNHVNAQFCPVDDKGEACGNLKNLTKRILLFSGFVWLTGFCIAYVLPFFYM